jgi:hypothetical protein
MIAPGRGETAARDRTRTRPPFPSPAGEILDRLRRREEEMEEQLTAVRERLAAVERWRCLLDASAARAVLATGDGVPAENAEDAPRTCLSVR